ncbi:lysophospholipid acyltransferase family protein [Acidicapsa acidisoli]|uniref:lysophospholipid acyltransferase family protein n=1 Tax=Acidicapsa acidisoli TaxID=1615681 RepID=UPI0021E0DFCF|nr:lysophospholipid acyltransferase family protein [Acidicapsa acidisoli]
MIASLLILASYLVMGLPTALVCIPWCLITGDVMPLYRASLFVVRTGFRLAGVRIQVEGLELVPQGVACIFMSNHVSNLDPPVLIPLLPGRTSVFLKRSLMKIPVLGYGMRLAEFVPVDRGGTVEGALESTKRASAVLGKGIHITTFVEGTRSRDGRMLPFKKGPFYLAMETGAPCVPISISGTESMMRKGSMRIEPGLVRVIFHPPIYPASVADRDALMLAVRESIASGLPERMRG